ncbi:hypothetical protein BJX70DRAFT_402528 [Aspergillus crustosus]
MTPTRSAASRKKRSSIAKSLDYINGVGNRTAVVTDSRQTQSAKPLRQLRKVPRPPRGDIFDIPTSPGRQPKAAFNLSPRRSTRLHSNAQAQSSPLKPSNRTKRAVVDRQEHNVEMEEEYAEDDHDVEEDEEEDQRLPSDRINHEPLGANEDYEFYGNFNLFSDGAGSAHHSSDSRGATPSASLRQDLDRAEQFVWTSTPLKKSSRNQDLDDSPGSITRKQGPSEAYRSTPNTTGPPPSVVINKGLDTVLETPPAKRQPIRKYQSISPAADIDNDGDAEMGEDHDVTRNNGQDEIRSDDDSAIEYSDSSNSSLFVRQDTITAPDIPSSEPQLIQHPSPDQNTTQLHPPGSAEDEEGTAPQAGPSGTRRTRKDGPASPRELPSKRLKGAVERPGSKEAPRIQRIRNRKSVIITNFPGVKNIESLIDSGEVEEENPESDSLDPEGQASVHESEQDSEYEASDSGNETEAEPETELKEPEKISPRHAEALKLGRQQQNWQTLINVEHDIKKNITTNSTMKINFEATLETIQFLQGWYEDIYRRSKPSRTLSSTEAQKHADMLEGISLDGDNIMSQIADLINAKNMSSHNEVRKLFDGFETNIMPVMIQLVFAIFDAYHSNSRRFTILYRHLQRALEVLSWFSTRMNALSKEKTMRCHTRTQALVKPLEELVEASKFHSFERPESQTSRQNSRTKSRKEAVVTRPPWTDAEGAALFAGLRRYQGPGRYAIILKEFPALKRRTIQELRQMAQEKGDQILALADVRDELSTPEGRERWHWLVSVRH